MSVDQGKTINELRDGNKTVLAKIETFQNESKRFHEDNETLRKQNETLRKENDELKKLIELLRQEIVDLKEENKEQQKAIVELKDAAAKEKALKDAFDLSRMYVNYFVVPPLQHSGSSWKLCSDELAKQRAQLEDHEITQQQFDAWLDTQPERDSLVSLQEIGAERLPVAHTDVRSATNQKVFLGNMQQRNFDILPEKKAFIGMMLRRLETAKLARMN